MQSDIPVSLRRELRKSPRFWLLFLKTYKGAFRQPPHFPSTMRRDRTLSAQCTRPSPGTTLTITVSKGAGQTRGTALPRRMPGPWGGARGGARASVSPEHRGWERVGQQTWSQEGARPGPREADREQQDVISKATGCLFSLDVLGPKHLRHVCQVCTPRLHLTSKPDRRQAEWSLPSLRSHLP